ncbi:MAG: precorrin-6A synthase (deacetylating) [Rhizobiaceae bacterium]
MIELLLIGIGTGNPDHLTRQGELAIREADAVLIPRKGEGKSDLADLRREICAKVLGENANVGIIEFDLPVRDAEGDYFKGVDEWHDEIAVAWQNAVAGTGQDCTRIALLIWGDPSLYDSSLRIASRLFPVPRITVVPGITALQALTAAHAIPLNDIGAPVLITTGRKLREEGWPKDANTVVVMLDGKCSFEALDAEGIEIWWGAFLGMKEELILHGPLSETGRQIVEMRSAARKTHGWIMDTYLMRRENR